jgi:hypothetical protein
MDEDGLKEFFFGFGLLLLALKVKGQEIFSFLFGHV